MLDPKLIRTEPEKLAADLKRKNFVLDTELLACLDSQRKSLQLDTEALQEEESLAAPV